MAKLAQERELKKVQKLYKAPNMDDNFSENPYNSSNPYFENI